jgi:hypothetical protein
LEGEVETNDEWMIDLLEDVDLSDHKLGLLAQNYLLLLEYLQSVHLFVLQALAQKYLPKRTLAQQLQ